MQIDHILKAWHIFYMQGTFNSSIKPRELVIIQKKHNTSIFQYFCFYFTNIMSLFIQMVYIHV